MQVKPSCGLNQENPISYVISEVTTETLIEVQLFVASIFVASINSQHILPILLSTPLMEHRPSTESPFILV